MVIFHIVEGYLVPKWGFVGRETLESIREFHDVDKLDKLEKFTHITASNGTYIAYGNLENWNLDEERDIIPAKAIITDKLENING